jgi:uncharacterized protein YbjT (DUF2867 family)
MMPPRKTDLISQKRLFRAMVRPMRIFVAGATGATGQVFVPRALTAGHDVTFHVRPQSATKSPLGKDPRARVFDLGDLAALAIALGGVEAVVSFVGTMRSRFKVGDTYRSSDIASTGQLVAGAVAAKVPRFILQSSMGAGSYGAYLKMKAECEAIVKASGLRWTILRPSGLVSPKGIAEGAHGLRRAPPGMNALFVAIRAIPGLGAWADDYRPIPIDILCDAILHVLAQPRDGATLAGRDLWALATPTI